MSEISLTVNGVKYSGWEAVNVNKSLLQLAGSFGFSTTNIFPYKPEQFTIRMGDECTVEVDDQVLITGYVEDIPISYDKEAHTIQVAGRDVTGDLVDCSYIEEPTEWLNQSIENIIKAICDPFDIEVVVDDSVATEAAAEIKKFTIDQGQTALELIARVCMHKAILPVCYGDGKLTLTRAGTERTDDNMELGVNIKTGLTDQSNRERFSQYIVKAQDVVTAALPWDTGVVNRHGEATDNVIERYRPLIILAEEPKNDKESEQRAWWEARVRAGQSRKVEYQVQGWTQRNGKVWPLNSLVTVKDSFLGIDGTMLISALDFNVDNTTGTVTTISVVPKGTFELLEQAIEEDATGLLW
jgi:prophage tail gpP-like protein